MSDIYDDAFFHSNTIKETALQMLGVINHLNSLRKRQKIDTLISRGSSGCTIASAMLALSSIDLHHVFVRKPHENSHGDCDKAGHRGKGLCVMVDDFISTGETARKILDFANDNSIKVVAILLGSRSGETFFYNGHKKGISKIKVWHCGKGVN